MTGTSNISSVPSTNYRMNSRELRLPRATSGSTSFTPIKFHHRSKLSDRIPNFPFTFCNIQSKTSQIFVFAISVARVGTRLDFRYLRSLRTTADRVTDVIVEDIYYRTIRASRLMARSVMKVVATAIIQRSHKSWPFRSYDRSGYRYGTQLHLTFV